MASTYSSLKIQLMATGENNNTWGDITNTNLGTAIEEAIVGSSDVTFASGNVTLTLTDSNATQSARNLRLNLIGTTAGARDLIVPTIEKFYIINNGCADAVTVKTSAGTGIAVPAGKTSIVYVDATNVVDAVTHLTSLTLASSLPVTSGGTGTTTSTGTGSVVLSNSPTLVTPALGTPSSATLTNATGLPISTGVSGLGSGVATFLGTPSSSNLAAAVTDETGSGALVFGTSPTITSASLVTPALGTPASGVMTNVTGLPISTGVSGLGTGVATFLGTPSSSNLAAAVTDETGSGALVFATSPTLVTPLLGTPTSGVMTNVTGLPLTTGVTGTLPVGNGGTGATSFTSNGILYGGATVGVTAAGTTGQVLVGNTGGAPSWGAATGVAVTSINFGTTGLTPSTATQGAVTVAGTLAVANGGTGVTTSTGTGAVVLSNSPTLVTPALGTPSSATLTNATGLPISTGVSGLAANVATFLGTPSSANLAAAVTDETGSGALVFATSPTLVTPALGTPASGVMTNVTGLPISTGVSGLGTGVATFLATPSSANLAAAVTGETGTGALVFATSPTLVTPALGTPSSATLTNATGLPISTGVSGLGTGVATFLGTPSSANLAAAVTDETGTGALVFATSPSITTPTLNGQTNASSLLVNGAVSTTSSGGVGVKIGRIASTPSNATDAFIGVHDTGGPGTLAGDIILIPRSTTGVTSAIRMFTGPTAPTERLTITSTGNVGIGTTSPATLLHVVGGYARVQATSDGSNGVIQVYDTAASTLLQIYNDSTKANIAVVEAKPMLFYTTNLERMRIAANGNVGIGTNDPSAAKVQVVGDQLIVSASSGTGGLGVQIKGTALGAIPAAQVQGYIATGDSAIGVAGDLLIAPRTSAAASVRFITGTTPSERMRIDPTGNVGIGTSSPAHALVVRKEGDARIYIEDDNANGRGGYLRSVTGGVVTLGTTSGVRDLVFAPDNTERMRVNTSGNVGIGTSSPASMLHVSFSPPASVPALGSGAGALALGPAASYGTLLGTISDGSGYIQQQRFDGAGTPYSLLLQPNGGNVGIGTSSPASMLHVTGLITIGTATAMLTSSVAMNDGAAAAAGTLLNAPAAGNPTKWIPFNDNGTTRYIPAW